MFSKASQSLTELIVNQRVANAIFSEIAGNNVSLIPQPVIVIGEFGSGKTTLLKRVYDSKSCGERSRVWIDGRTVFSSEDIISPCGKTGGSIVFVDDFDFYMTRCDYEEQYRLRRFLNEENAPMLIATVSKVLPAMTDYRAPFFEGLKNFHIPPVSVEDISDELNGKQLGRARRLLELLPPTVKSLHAIYNVVKLNDNPDNDVDSLLSIFSEKYRSCYENMPANSQRILNAFQPWVETITIPELRDGTGLPTGALTPYLKKLESLRIIRTDKSIRRKTRYSMRDPLFKLWLAQSDITK